ncbi:DUF4166 domain-containing protein [Leucobacter zeae]|nr:DUF4166 domain-containing protein [Leucobacter zeae]
MAPGPEDSRRSPYARALGARASELDPLLRDYFASIPPGRVGVGTGVFDRVGTPRRWLWPLLAVLQPTGAVRAGWATDVPFRIENRTVDGRAESLRRFRFASGDWVMRDAVALSRSGRLVDTIGPRGRVIASFDLDVRDGGLQLISRTVGFRIGRRIARLPRALAPVVRLSERQDAESGRQRVDVTIDVPVIGRVYAYGGSFRYRIEEDA